MALKRPRTPEVSEPGPAPTKALTAATANVVLGKSAAWGAWKFGNRDWQIEAWRLFDIVGELRFLAAWIGDSISQARLYVTRISDTGEETGEVDDPRIAQLASVPLGTGSQRDDNLRLLGIDLAVAGEAWIVAEDGGKAKPKSWFVLSGGQIRREGGIVTVRRPLQAGGEPLRLTDGRDLLIRVWRPHPNDIWQSDSPTRSAIPPLREIELLTKREFAELESRLTGAGVWFLPEGLDFPRGTGSPEGMDGFLAHLQEVVAENIRDQSRASALVPVTVTVPDNHVENIDKFKPVHFWSELSNQILDLKKAAIARVAASFEIPSELLALGDSNHWTAWAVGEEGIKRIKPYLSTIADTLTRGFLIPVLEREGVADADQYAYVFDVSPLAVRPNRLEEALQLWDRGLLSGPEAVKLGAFTEDQMPQGRERIIELVYKAVSQVPTLLADPAIQQIIGLTEPAPIAVEVNPVAELPATPEPTTPGPPDNLNEGPSTTPPASPKARALTASVIDPAVLIGAKGAVLRALEIVGSRLVTRSQRKGHYAQVPKHEIHVKVGPLVPSRALRVLDGVWTQTDILATDLKIPEEALREQLHWYSLQLLVYGRAHRDEDLAEALEGLL